MSRLNNYTGRHTEVKKDTTKTPPKKMFGPVKRGTVVFVYTDREAQAIIKFKGAEGFVSGGRYYPGTFKGAAIQPSSSPIEEFGVKIRKK